MRILVLGASGGCGRWLCRLAVNRGHRVRAVVRPETPCELPGEVEVMRAQLHDASALARNLDGCDAVLSAVGIRRRGPRNPWSRLLSPPDLTTRLAERLVGAMPAKGVSRLVAVSAAGVGDSFARTHPVLRGLIRHSNMAASYEDLADMEARLAASSLDWLAVRPTTLTRGAPRGDAGVVERYGLLARIRRSDLAGWMLDAVEWPEPFAERTPMIRGGAG